MRIVRAAVYTDAVLRRTGGEFFASETFVVFAAGLRDHIDRLVLIARVDPLPAADHYPIRDVEVVELPHYGSLTDPGAVLRAGWASVRRFHAALDDVDVVWLLGPHPLALLFALVSLARRRRVVLGVRQDMPAHMRARHPTRRSVRAVGIALEGAWRALARALPTVVVGPDLACRYRHARSLLPIVVSMVGDDDVVSPETATARSYSGRQLTLLSVGRLDPEKNPLLLAEVLERLRESDDRWRLVVCGDGSMRDALERELRDRGLGGHAHLLGFRALPELRRWYRESHALAHISWTEGVPQVAFEAFAGGLPVVATDVGGVAEAVDGAALVVPPGDARAVVEAVIRLTNDPGVRRTLVRRGIEVARAHTGDAERSRLATFLTGQACRIDEH